MNILCKESHVRDPLKLEQDFQMTTIMDISKNKVDYNFQIFIRPIINNSFLNQTRFHINDIYNNQSIKRIPSTDILINKCQEVTNKNSVSAQKSKTIIISGMGLNSELESTRKSSSGKP